MNGFQAFNIKTMTFSLYLSFFSKYKIHDTVMYIKQLLCKEGSIRLGPFFENFFENFGYKERVTVHCYFLPSFFKERKGL